MFGLHLEIELEDETKYETAFKTFDAADYSLIATIETKKCVLGLCCSWDDDKLAIVELARSEVSPVITFILQGKGDSVESVVRLYDVGRLRAEEEDLDGEDDGGPENEDSDGSDDEMGGGDEGKSL